MDILTNSVGLTNVGTVVINSGLKLSVSQLQEISAPVVTQGEGRLDVKVSSPEDVAVLAEILATVVQEGQEPLISGL